MSSFQNMDAPKWLVAVKNATDSLDTLMHWVRSRVEHIGAEEALCADPVDILNDGRGWCNQRCIVFLWLVREIWNYAGARHCLVHNSNGDEHVICEVETPEGLQTFDVDFGLHEASLANLRRGAPHSADWPDGLQYYYQPSYLTASISSVENERDRNIVGFLPGVEEGMEKCLLSLMGWIISHYKDTASIPAGLVIPEQILAGAGGDSGQRATIFIYLAMRLFNVKAGIVQLSHTDGASQHPVAQAWYDEGWHLFDFHVSHPTIYRKSGGRILGYADLQSDPGIVALQDPGWRGQDGRGMEGFYIRPGATYIPPTPEGPRSLSFMLGWRCNARCTMCWQATSRERGLLSEDEISTEDVQKILARYASTIENVELCSFGEPTMHPGIGKIIEAICALPKIKSVSMITNGSYLERISVLGRIPGSITISLDSFYSRTYKEIRAGLDLNSVLGGIRAFLSARSCPTRLVGINMVVTRRNERQVEAMAILARDYGLDYLCYLRGANMRETAAPDDELPEGSPVGQRIAQIKSMYESGGFTINNYFASVEASTKDARAIWCTLPWETMSVSPQGNFHPCCKSYGTVLGNVQNDPWEGTVLKELREQLRTRTLDTDMYPECCKCLKV